MGVPKLLRSGYQRTQLLFVFTWHVHMPLTDLKRELEQKRGLDAEVRSSETYLCVRMSVSACASAQFLSLCVSLSRG